MTGFAFFGMGDDVKASEGTDPVLQGEHGPPRGLGQLSVANTTIYDRTSLVRATMSLAEHEAWPWGVMVSGRRAMLEPFGALWPNGSPRYGRVSTICDVGAASTMALPIEEGQTPAQPWTWGKGLRQFGLAFLVGDVAHDLMATLAWDRLAKSDVLRRFRGRGRIPDTPLCVELWLEVFNGLDFAHSVLRYWNSDPGSSNLRHEIGETALVAAGCTVAPWADANKVTEVRGERIVITRAGGWYDGCGQRVRFSLLFPHKDADTSSLQAEVTGPLKAVYRGWSDAGSFSPWGVLPKPPEPITPRVAALEALRSMGGHWQVPPYVGAWEPAYPHGNAWNPNQTGAQPDFGCLSMQLELEGWPHRLGSVMRSVDQEECRWTHIREPDGSPVDFERRDVELWGCRPDLRINPVPCLGKEPPEVPLEIAPGHEGYQPTHFFPAHTLYYGMVTGDPVVLAEVHHLADCFLGQCKNENARSVVLRSPMAPRAEGRTLHTGVLLWMLTGRADVLVRCVERLEQVIAPTWHGRLEEGSQRWMSVRPPHPNHFGGEVQYVDPWMESIAVRGLQALWRVTGNQNAKLISEAIAVTIGDTSFVSVGGSWKAVGALEYRDGEMHEDLRKEVGDVFLSWYAPAAIVAQRVAKEKGDGILETRMDSVLQQLRGELTWESAEWLAMD